ncbi:MAG: hypothetical protein PF439_00860 [Helicobacteraceae bacterium]|jgi:hypothetical protein|nr:hypothetical protein [Helicobacteraceae bacterium]
MTDASSNFSIQKIFAKTFTYIFFGLSAAIILSTFTSALENILNGEEITSIIIQMVNTSIIAIAVFELAIVINKEYGNDNEHDVVDMLRRTLPRFIGTVCVALSLEGLIMVIKYSQLDLAGNLYYPVAIISSAAFLLIALGVFLKFSPTK